MFGHMYGYGYPGTLNWWWMAGFAILNILIVVGIIVLIIRLVNKSRQDREIASSSSKAIEILKEKYVLGEIDEEEYQRKLKILRY